jgi:hypothetical protein
VSVEYVVKLLQPKNSSVFRASEKYTFTPMGSGVNFKTTASKKEYSSENVANILSAMQKKSELGYVLFLGKHNKDALSRKKAIMLLTQHASKQMHDKIIRTSGRRYVLCMKALSAIVIGIICRTADDAMARCRCKGRGSILVNNETKTCPSCKGTGVKTLPSANVFRVIKTLLPDISQSSWSRHWKPFYEYLVSYCEQELFAVEGVGNTHM